MVGRTRVHLDQVVGLGAFVELELVLQDEESSDGAVLEAQQLMNTLGIDSSQLIEGTYVDLLSHGDR